MAETKKVTKKSGTKAKPAVKAKRPKVEKVAKESGTFAVIETGGKQYRVWEGDTIRVEKLQNSKEGEKVTFDKVLLVDDGNGVTDIGTPYISGAKVLGSVVEVGRGQKVVVIKYKQKSRYFKKNGHRQPFTKVKIEKIG